MIIDLHCHTRHGSSCSHMSPEEMLEQAVKVGLDGLCITEHEILWDRDATKRLSDQFGILVIGGIEISTACGDVLVFGLDEPVFDVQDMYDLRRRVDSAGGVMIAAHPFRGTHDLVRWDSTGGVVLNVAEAIRRPIFEVVDAIEVFNGMATEWETDLSSAVCDNLPMAGTGGSDAHSIEAVGDCVTVLDKKVNSEEAFLQEMRQRSYLAHFRVRNRFYSNNGEAHFLSES